MTNQAFILVDVESLKMELSKAVATYKRCLVSDKKFQIPLEHARGCRINPNGKIYLIGSGAYREIAKIYHLFQKGKFEDSISAKKKHKLNLDDLDIVVVGGLKPVYSFPSEWTRKVTDFGTDKYIGRGFAVCYIALEKGLNNILNVDHKTIDEYLKRTPTNIQSIAVDITDLRMNSPNSVHIKEDGCYDALRTKTCRVKDEAEAVYAAAQRKKDWNIKDYVKFIAETADLEFMKV